MGSVLMNGRGSSPRWINNKYQSDRGNRCTAIRSPHTNIRIYPFHLNRTQKDRIESSFKSKKKSGFILSSIWTPIFCSISKALNVVLLGAIQPERVYYPPKKKSKSGQNNPQNRRTLGYGRDLI
jgi:hypothetical protein